MSTPHKHLTGVCTGCNARWGGSNTCHCAVTQSEALTLLPMGDGDTEMFTQRYFLPDERPVDVAGIPVELFANLKGTEPLDVKLTCRYPPARSVFKAMLPSGQWTQIHWSIVGPVSIDVVNVLSINDPITGDPVLIGFDVLAFPDTPPETDVPVAGGVPLRVGVGHLFTSGKKARRDKVPFFLAGDAEPPLRGTSDRDTASAAGLGDLDHPLILVVRSLCHRSFSGIGAFDKHRKNYQCLDPATITTTQGSPVLQQYERSGYTVWGNWSDGSWTGPGSPA